MNETDVLLRARMYMELLAQGIDPVSGAPLPPGSFSDPARLGRCFSYVSGVLGKVIDNGGVVGQKVRHKKFCLTPEQRACVVLSPEPVRMVEFIDLLYRAAGDPDMKKLSAAKISDHMMERGFVVKEQTPSGGNRKVPTETGRRLGLTTKWVSSRDGEYLSILYDTNAQRYLLENLDLISEGK